MAKTFWKQKKPHLPKIHDAKYPKRSTIENKLIAKHPYKDNDHDKVMNWYDCKPLERKKQDVMSAVKSIPQAVAVKAAQFESQVSSIKDKILPIQPPKPGIPEQPKFPGKPIPLPPRPDIPHKPGRPILPHPPLPKPPIRPPIQPPLPKPPWRPSQPEQPRYPVKPLPITPRTTYEKKLLLKK